MEKAFLTQNLIKPQMALEEKPHNVLLIISKYQLTGKKRKDKKNKTVTANLCTHTHEEKSRQWIREEAVMVGIDKPCIFTLW